MEAKSHHGSGLLYALRGISLNGRQQALEMLLCTLNPPRITSLLSSPELESPLLAYTCFG